MKEAGSSYRHVSISTEQASKDLLACPRCGGRSIIIEGHLRREFVEEFEDGVSSGFDLGDAMEKNILSIVCHACHAVFHIEQDEVMGLRQQVMELQEDVATMYLQGIDIDKGKVS